MHYKNIEQYIAGEKDRIAVLEGSQLENFLIIEKVYLSRKRKWEADYSVVEEVEELEIDEHGIMWDRHRTESWFRERLREGHIYPKWSVIRQERHILIGTEAMSERISERMNTHITPELLWWNMVLGKSDGWKVYLDGLPLGTDLMICSETSEKEYSKENLIVNLRLVTFQKGCGVTWVSIANEYQDRSQVMNFVKHSETYRWAICAIDGPTWRHILRKGQKVFIGIPQWYIH